MTWILASFGLAVLPVGAWLLNRPQRGVLLLCALLPLDGLLLVVPGGGAAGPWKELLLLLVLAATFWAPQSARRSSGDPVPSWAGVLFGYVAIGALAAVLTGGVAGLWGFKIGYFYALVPLILWRCPLSGVDRDRLVTVLMTTGLFTAAVGLGQQVLGADRLHNLGYEYNTAIRFSGSLLRSFSTFTQPFPFGLFLCLVLLVGIPVALADVRRLRNMMFLVLTPVLVVAMASSVVRGAFLCAAVGALVLAVWRYRLLVHGLIPLLVALVLLPPAVLSAFLSSSSLDQRASGWSTVADRVTGAPWGNGLGITGAAAEKALEFGARPTDVLMVGGQRYQPDNQFVKTAIELGVVGLWVLLLVMAALVVAGIRVARSSELAARHADRALAEGIVAATVGIAAASTVATYLEIFPLDFYFWLFVGVILCLDRPSTSTRSPSDPAEAASRPTFVSSSGP